MKKITRKRFTQSKGTKSFFGSVARFGAAIPLCLLMLGGLSFVSFDSANAATASNATPTTDATGATGGVPGTFTLINGVNNSVMGGHGGDAATTTGGNAGGLTTVSGTGVFGDIVFGTVQSATGVGAGGRGGDSGAASGAAGGAAGGYKWSPTGSVTVNSLVGLMGAGGTGGDAVTATYGGGDGGAGDFINIDLGTRNLTVVGNNGAGVAIDLVSSAGGAGGIVGAGMGGSVAVGGAGGDGVGSSFTAGSIFVTQQTGNNASVKFGAGAGGNAGAASATPAGTTAGAISGDGGVGGDMTVTLAGGITFNAANAANNNLSFVAGLGGNGADGTAPTAAGQFGQSGGHGGAGGNLLASVGGNITVRDNMSLRATAAGSAGNGGDAFAAATGGAGGHGGDGGFGGDATLSSGSIKVDGNLSVAGGNASNGGNGGVGPGAANSLAGGNGGVGGDGGAASLTSLGSISVAGGFALTSGEGGTGGIAGGNGNSAGAVGGSGGNGGVGGDVTVNADRLTVGGSKIIANGRTAATNAVDAVAAGFGGSIGSTGKSGNVDINVTNTMTVVSNLEIEAHGGNGSSSNANGAAGVAGSDGGNVNITAKELRVGGALTLRNAAGITGTAVGGATAGTVGAAGAAGEISFLNTMVYANYISGTSTATYKMGGLGLDAENQKVTFQGDMAYTNGGLGLGVGTLAPGTANYNIGNMLVDANAYDLPADTDTYTANGQWLNTPGGNKVYRAIEAENLSRLNVANFSFVLPTEVKANDVMLDVTNNTPTAVTTDDLQITNATGVSIETPARIRNMHRNLGTIELISGEVNGADTVAGRRINSGIYRFNTRADANGNLVADLDGIPGFNAYSEAQAARLAFVADGLNHVITSGIYEMSRATEGDELGIRVFASGYGSKNRYSTGYQSYADIEGAGFLIGAGWATDTVDGQRLLAGAFMEAGWGAYDNNSASHGVSFTAKGDTNYFGGGIMGKYTFPFGLYFDLSARMGSSKLDFRSDDLGTNGYENSFDSTNTMYYGGHIGGGYEWAIDEVQSVDFNTRLLWTHLNSDNVRSNYGDDVEFESADSIRWRTGARYNYAFDLGTGGTIKPFVGVAYEQEFDGDARTRVDGRRTERTASLDGPTVIGELGASWQATDNFSLELAGQGNVFTRQGGSGQLSLKWEF